MEHCLFWKENLFGKYRQLGGWKRISRETNKQFGKSYATPTQIPGCWATLLGQQKVNTLSMFNHTKTFQTKRHQIVDGSSNFKQIIWIKHNCGWVFIVAVSLFYCSLLEIFQSVTCPGVCFCVSPPPSPLCFFFSLRCSPVAADQAAYWPPVSPAGQSRQRLPHKMEEVWGLQALSLAVCPFAQTHGFFLGGLRE